MAVHVRVIVKVFAQAPGVVTSFTTTVISIDALQLSVTVTDVGSPVGILSHSTVMAPGTFAINGAVVSSTLIVWIAVEVLLHSSVAVHVRVIV